MLLSATTAAAQDAAGNGRATAWTLDSASVTFTIRNAGLPVHGSIGGLDARICFAPDTPAAGSIIASMDPGTIDTGIGMRDRHLSRRGYFDIARFGRVEMRSTALERAGTGYTGTFALRMRDVERVVEIPFTFADSGAGARIAGSLTLNRLDWGIGGESLILSDSVTITVDLALVRSESRCA